METFVVDKSSYEILMEIAEILEKKRSSVNRAKLSNFSTQMPNEILKDSKMVDSSCSEVPVVENSLSLMPEVKDTKIEIKSKNDEGFKTNKTVDIIYPIFSKSGQNEGFAEIKRNLSDDHFEVLDSEIKGNVNINSLLISCNSFEISAINTIRQILSNKNDSEIAYNSLMNQIEYANVKLISVMNILQYSISTFEHQLSTASYETMIDYLTIVHYIDEFNDLLNNVSSAKKLVDIRNFYTPISRVNNANSYAFLVSTCCDFIRSLECCKEEESKVLYNQILEIIEALGSLETIYEKLKFRDDNFYSILLRRICSNPVLHFPPGNSSILENFWSIKNSPLNETLNTFVIFDQSNVMSTKNKLRLERSPQFIEDENVRYLRNRSEIHILALMQCNIQYWKEYEHSAQLEIVNEGLKEFEKTLKSLEVSEIKKTELGTFVYKLVDDLDYVLSEHVRRIFISHFYSFLFVTCTTFFKSLPEIFSTICSPRQISEKLQFRNDAVFLKYREIFGMKKCRVMKPSKEILQDVWDIWNCYGTFFEQICGRNGQMFVTERKFFNNGQTSTKIVKNEFTKYRNLKVLKNEFNITPFGTEMLREMLSRGEKKGQNISFMYQTQNNEYEIKILNFDHKLYFHRTLKNVYLSIVQKRAMSNSEYINLGNEKKIFAKHKNNFHMKFEIPGNQKDECTFWTSLLYFSRDYEDIEIDSEFIKTLESFVYSKE
ncbi:hypothetical protein HHI36_002521 [Cryptolaemus montrouzieri]|uniref:Uncharacterized protein n=1 Tax=Cryptolaemus montrouzieri TaxID=559131 RepID=A0ABD2PB87_9CUCU